MTDPDELWPPRPSPSASPPQAKRPAGAKNDPIEKKIEGPVSGGSGRVNPEDNAPAQPDADVWPPKKSDPPQSSTKSNPTRDAGSENPPDDSPAPRTVPPHKKSVGGAGGASRPLKPHRPVITLFQKYADFSGRASRADFWAVYVVYVILAVTFINIDEALFALFFLLALLPSLAVSVRRLRDAGYRWPWVLTLLVPFLGFVVLAVLGSKPSKFSGDDADIEFDGAMNGGVEVSAGRIPPLVVEQTPLDGLKESEVPAINLLAFLFAGPGLFARFLYLDARQLWRNRHRQTEFAGVSFMFVLFTLGLGYIVTSNRWWGHSGEARFKKLAWLGLVPIVPATVALFLLNMWPEGPLPADQAGLPFVLVPVLLVGSIILSLALGSWAFGIANKMMARLA
jgi:hypothetical protein